MSPKPVRRKTESCGHHLSPRIDSYRELAHKIYGEYDTIKDDRQYSFLAAFKEAGIPEGWDKGQWHSLLPGARPASKRKSASIPKWDKRYLHLAREISTWSKDPSTGVGAVIVDANNRVVSMGFNGLPRKIKDDIEVLHNRDLKLRMTIHAEVNAIHFAKQDVTGCTLYVYPIPPCINCASSIIQEGISRVVTVVNDSHNPRWMSENETSCKMFAEAGIEVVQYDRNQLD